MVKKKIPIHQKHLLSALRPRQWVKNLLIFFPLIFGKKLFVFPENLNLVIAFVIFCLASSAVYLINDIIDINRDQVHPTKSLRPIASGKVSVKQAIAIAFILGILSLIFSFILNIHFGYAIVIYLLLNLSYSKLFKNIFIIDVFCIGVFFLLRLISGSIVGSITLSHWIITMMMLLALFLGFNKRRQELMILGERAENHRLALNKYSLCFIDQMTTVIAFAIVLIYTLYSIDTRTVSEFRTRNLIYSTPFVYYGIFRYLYLIRKINSDGDPTQVLFSDKKIQLNIILWMITCIAIIYFAH